MTPSLTAALLLTLVALILTYTDWEQMVRLRTRLKPPHFDFGTMTAVELSAHIKWLIEDKTAFNTLQRLTNLRIPL